MTEQLMVVRGSTFFVSDDRGDVRARIAEGLFVADVRHLSLWELLVGGEPLQVLGSRALGYERVRVVGTLATSSMDKSPPVSVVRERSIAQGVRDRVTLESHTSRSCRVVLELRYGSDFIDIFQARGAERFSGDGHGASWVEHEDDTVRLCHRTDGFERVTALRFWASRSTPSHITDDAACFYVELRPRDRWELSVSVSCSGDGIPSDTAGARTSGRGIGERTRKRPPELRGASRGVERAYEQSVADLVALTLPPDDPTGAGAPAAGLPWFMTLFGRDSLITSYQALPFMPELARATLPALAALQAERDDAFRDAEPGKMLHELRRGRLARLGRVPHTPYYGTHDATPLFLVLLDEYELWTGDVALVRTLEGAARRALDWIDRYGDLDGDGYLEYARRSPLGLHNQCWKDSDGSTAFADGRVAQGPIATCEIQGYAYDAKRRTARLARDVWGDDELAARLEREADELKERFARDFWSESRGHFVLALDRDKRQVDSLTSNIGHLLWSGIVEPDRARATVERLMAPELYTGWGIRTMATSDAAYNPIGYHVGTVWPHDTGLVAEGMRRYGFAREASQVAAGLLAAADLFDHRLPEVFAGFDRAELGAPVNYPTASRPQAWAAGAILLALRTLLGLDVRAGMLVCSPELPRPLGGLAVSGLMVRGERVAAP